MVNKMTKRGTIATALTAGLLIGAASPALAAEIDWGSETNGIITLDNEITGITFGEGNAPDKNTPYSDPQEFSGNITEEQRQQLISALIAGQAIADGSFDAQAQEIIGDDNNIDPGTLKNPLAEAISAQVTNILSGDSANVNDPTVSAIIDELNKISAEGSNVGEETRILVAEPEDNSYSSLIVLTNAGIPSLADIAALVGDDNIQLRTSAGNEEGNVLTEGSNITDQVRYTGLTPGQEYRLVGEAVSLNSEGEAVETGDNVGEQVFTPKEADGTVSVTIPLNSVTSDSIVVFETLYDADDNIVSEHKDPTDKAQTITSESGGQSSIRTSADSNTGDYIQTGTIISDTVTYTGLTPGKEYRLEARLQCKETNTDTGASATHTFTPDEADGTTVVEGISVLDSDCSEQVVYEKLYDNETDDLVAAHEDLEDQAQTIGGSGSLGKKKNDDYDKKTPTPTQEQGQGGGQHPAPTSAPQESAPRQVIDDMPSGESSGIGSTLFTR